MNSSHQAHVRQCLPDLNLAVVREDPGQDLIVVSNEDEGIVDMMLVFEEQTLTLAQHILNLANPDDAGVLRRLLQLNGTLAHGAFALDDSGRRVVFRDTLELDTLDFGELSASVHALSLALAEHGAELAGFAALPAHA